MNTGGQKRKSRNYASSKPEKHESRDEVFSNVEDSDLEPGEIAHETDTEMEDSIEDPDRQKELMSDDNSTPSPKPRRESKKQRIEVERREKHRTTSRRETSRHRRHSSNHRTETERVSALTYRERERMRKKEDSSPRRRRSNDHRHRSDSHRRRHSKRRKRHHRDKNRDREDDVKMTETQIDESELIERQREERRKRIEAIKSKHQQLAQQKQQNQEQDSTMRGSEDGGSGKSTSDVQPHVNENAESAGGSLSPDSVSSVELTLVSRKAEDAKTVESGLSPDESQLKAKPAELVIDKPIQTLEKDECSTDHLAMLKDEKHDKEKLLEDTQVPAEEASLPPETDDIFCDSPEGSDKAYSGLDNAVRKAVSLY